MRAALAGVIAVAVACGPASAPRSDDVIGLPADEAEAPAVPEMPSVPGARDGPPVELGIAGSGAVWGVEVCGPRGWPDCLVTSEDGHSPSVLWSFRAHFHRRCERDDDVGACIKAGVMQANGDGGPVYEVEARRSFAKACLLEASVCTEIARALMYGDGVPENDELAIELARGGPVMPALPGSANVTLTGDELAAKEEGLQDVLWAYRGECNDGKAESCAKAAVMLDRGKGAERDRRHAYRLFFLACDLDRSLCMDISQAYGEGDKVGRNREYAKRFRKLALSPENREQGAACRYGDADRCVTFAHAYIAGEHVGRDEKYAAVLFEEACRAGDARGCAGLGELRWSGKGTYKDRHASVELFRKACDGRAATACWKLGRLYLRGEVIDQDVDRAEALFKRACDLGDQAGCDYIDGAPKLAE